MFYYRKEGEGELYTYLPLTQGNANAQLQVPQTIENTDYGFSVGRGAFTFTSGVWYTIAERIILNDPSESNGEVHVWINGQNVIALKGIQLRSSSDSVVQGMHFITFFGGK